MPHQLLLTLFKSRLNVPDTRKAYFDTNILLLPNSVTAKTLLTTFATMYPVPYGIELVGDSSTSTGSSVWIPAPKLRIIEHLARLRSDGRTDISHFTVKDQYLKMDAHTQLPLQSAPQ